MKRFLLSMLLLVLTVSISSGEVYTTKMQAVIYNDFDAFVSLATQTQFGQEATKKAMAQDIREGNAIIIPKGTKVVTVECGNHMCIIAVEGYSGYWFASEYSIK